MSKKTALIVFILYLGLGWGCKYTQTSENGNGNGNGNEENNSSNDNSQALIVDHRHTDITKIPRNWFKIIRETYKIHYAHTSHGEQITVGLEMLSNENSSYNFYPDNCRMPEDNDYLCLMDGQKQNGGCETYITPDLYWQGNNGMDLTRSVLSTFAVNISLWAWCTQLDDYSASQVQEYLDNMSQLESEYPNVTFIYMTGNAQSPSRNRLDRNNQIREYCRNNNKVCFDFADLDCWYGGHQYTQDGIPLQHPDYDGDQAGHTTYESCKNKAKAFWWLLARLSGWDGK